jgi:hypothetical protein
MEIFYVPCHSQTRFQIIDYESTCAASRRIPDLLNLPDDPVLLGPIPKGSVFSHEILNLTYDTIEFLDEI